MRLLEINECNVGSTGQIMQNIAYAYDGDYLFAVANSRTNKANKLEHCIYIGNRYSRNISLLFNKYTGINGVLNWYSTKSFLKIIDSYTPDIIHLHNLHNCYINLPILFQYIKSRKIPVIWTLHDCWAFTGQCPHFTLVKCDKWKTGCHDCPQYRNYPSSYFDRTKVMYKLKKKWFTNVKNMTIVTPSQWLADLVKQSFLKDYPVRVINNGIDLSIFKPMPNDFRKKYGIPEDKYIVLGVAFGWGKRKGLDVFIALSQKLDSKKYQIVLVGTDDVIDKILPKNIISIHRTHDPLELAQIYTSADVFANPSREENFPTVNIEALACGTPIVTFDIGGSAEIVSQGTGFVVTCDDIEGMKDAIIYLCSHKQHFTKSCLNRAKVYDMNNRFQEYSKLYLEKCGESNAS